jgi:hypothetical protein
MTYPRGGAGGGVHDRGEALAFGDDRTMSWSGGIRNGESCDIFRSADQEGLDFFLRERRREGDDIGWGLTKELLRVSAIEGGIGQKRARDSSIRSP